MENNEVVSAGQLRSYIERIEHLNEEKSNIQEDIKEVYAEAKGNGFDVTILRMLIKIRKMDKQDLQEQEELLELYRKALGE